MKTFDEIFTDKTKYGVKVQTSEYGKQGKYIIIDQGQSQIAGYTDREEGVFEELPVIVFGDHTRTIKYVDKPFFLGADGVKVLRSKDSNANYKYLYYALKSAKIPDTGYNRHFKWLKKIQINYPDNNRQEKIVKILDKVSDIIKNRESELSALDELIKVRFVEMFGDPVENPYDWPVANLTNFGECKNGMNFHTDDSGVEIHCLGVGDFKNLSLIEDTSKLPTISLNEMPSDDYLLVNGDIVFVRSNGNKALVGRSVVVYPDNIPTTFSGFCIRFRIRNSAILPGYLLRVLKTDSMRKKMAGRGANIQNLNQKILATLRIPIPELALQEEFEYFVKKVDKSKLTIQKALNETQLLFESLLQEYFK